MGEYGFYKKELVKIGTCEMMYYLRYEDRFAIKPEENSIDPSKEKNLFWRLPYLDEDNLSPTKYTQHNRTLSLFKKVPSKTIYGGDSYVYFWDDSLETSLGILSLRHPCGLSITLPCYHGHKLPEFDEKSQCSANWNGKFPGFIELAFMKNSGELGVVPVITCKACGNLWSVDWEDVLPYVYDEEMRKRLAAYEKAGDPNEED